MKHCPNYIKENIRKTNMYMQKIVELNMQLENSIENLGLTNDYEEYLHDEKMWPGYSIADPESLIEKIDDDLDYYNN